MVHGVPNAEMCCNNPHEDNPMARGLEGQLSSQPFKAASVPHPLLLPVLELQPQGSIPAPGGTCSSQKKGVMCSEKHCVLDQYPFCSSPWCFQGFIYLEPWSFQIRADCSVYTVQAGRIKICAHPTHKELKREGKKRDKQHSLHLGFAFLLKLHLNTD